MKKLLTGSAFVIAAFLIHAAGNNTAKAMSEQSGIASLSAVDTLPKKDTTHKDSLQYSAMNVSLLDTLPKKDTTKKDTMFSSAVAYRLVGDTIPKGDTTKKDTSFQSLAFNR